MIKEILDRDFVLSRLQAIDSIADGFVENARNDADESDDLKQSVEENKQAIEEALPLLRDAAARESQKESEGIEREAFVSRDAYLSLLQSALQEYHEEIKRNVSEPTAEQMGAFPVEPPVTNRELEGETMPTEDGAKKLFNKFTKTDIRWVGSKISEGIAWLRGKHAFNDKPAEPSKIANRARVVLVSDWGTGIPRAGKIGSAMRDALAVNTENRELHIMHLGDVYYSGWKREYEKHFLPFWPVKESEADRIGSWCLNANHDMYSGGYGYYDFLLSDRRFQRQQHSSFFSLQNDHWRILGLDTAYDDHALHDPQGEWLKSQLESDGRKGILLSHHQPFSAYERGGEKLLGNERLSAALDTDRVRAWFWGHEHRCALYEPRNKIAYPRCIGHGGVPEYASDREKPSTVRYVYQASLETNLFESWALFGFAVLDFDDAQINVRYINENRETHYEETLE